MSVLSVRPSGIVSVTVNVVKSPIVEGTPTVTLYGILSVALALVTSKFPFTFLVICGFSLTTESLPTSAAASFEPSLWTTIVFPSAWT